LILTNMRVAVLELLLELQERYQRVNRHEIIDTAG